MNVSVPLELSVIVLTYNEERNLPDCLKSVKGWTKEIFVVDSGSDDRTLEIAKKFGAAVFRHRFETHAKQWDWALASLPISTQWILAIDADQLVSPQLASEIKNLLVCASQLQQVHGAFIRRRQVFRNRWIRHGGYYPKYLLKLFRRDKVRIDYNDLVDHHFYVDGPLVKLKHDLIESNRKEDDISFWVEKHNRYAALFAQEEYDWRNHSNFGLLKHRLFGNPDERTLWLKSVWYRLPLYVRPALYFFYRYFLRLGFLDGKQGFIFHFLHSFWFRLLVDINLDELRKQLNLEQNLQSQPQSHASKV